MLSTRTGARGRRRTSPGRRARGADRRDVNRGIRPRRPRRTWGVELTTVRRRRSVIPAALTAAGSSRFRASTTALPRIAAAVAARSRSANSGHSVRIARTSAPSTRCCDRVVEREAGQSFGLDRVERTGRRSGRRHGSPHRARAARARMRRLGDSRRSSVPALKVEPERADDDAVETVVAVAVGAARRSSGRSGRTAAR